ncbi:uncharacterized protein LOC135372649 isoform X2 [Ornithodoros turicata]|uniref:uncharacterized protein LOC135372649 isoform X2 n=1 Tax=Ornithodoros turicata TaxID=34597 RepID=UPI0031388E6E
MEVSRERVALYAIVKFLDDSVAVVPCTWLADDGCFWPPPKDQKKVSLLVRKLKEPQPTWKLLPCKVLERYATYDSARAGLRLAEETSDLNPDIQYGRGKRRRISTIYTDSEESLPPTPPRPKCLSYTERKGRARDAEHLSATDLSQPKPASDQYNSPSHPQQLPVSSRNDLVPAHLVVTEIPSSSLSQLPRNGIEQERTVYGGQDLQDERSGTFSHSSTDSDDYLIPQARSQRLESQTDQRKTGARAGTDDHYVIPHGSSQYLKPHAQQQTESAKRATHVKRAQLCQPVVAGSLRDTHVVKQRHATASDIDYQYVPSGADCSTTGFEKKVLRSLQMITLRLLEHTEQLDAIVSFLQKPRDLHEGDAITEPFSDIQAFLSFDQDLHRSSEKREQLVRYIINIGGSSNGDKARRILCKLMTDEVATQFSWKGASGKNSFKSLECQRYLP